MRILHVSTLAGGGAFRAMERLHHGLLAAGEDSQCLLQTATADKTMHTGRGLLTARFWSKLDELPLRFYPNRKQEAFNLQWVPGGILKSINKIKPDIVHLHWVHRAFMRIEDFKKIEQPIIWTLHDSWLLTGGCHVPHECERYKLRCGKCPILGSSKNFDISRWVWNRKYSALHNIEFSIISPSRWLLECVELNPILKEKYTECIPHGINLDAYKPINYITAREILNINKDSKIVLFGTIGPIYKNKTKGGQFIKQTVNRALNSTKHSNFELLFVGSNEPDAPLDLGAPTRYLGRLHDDVAMRLAFCAADVTVVPSMQESFGQMASESLACGTPVVAFNTTGLKDIVDHGVNGLLATPYDPMELGDCVASILNNPDSVTMRRAAREKAIKEYDIKTMVDRHNKLYTYICTNAGR